MMLISQKAKRLNHIKNYCMYYDYLDCVNLEDLQFLIGEAEKYFKEDLIEKLIGMGCTKMKDGRQLYELTLTELVKEYEGVRNGKAVGA